ncbi:SMR family transporter [Brevibacillus massiliensis]|uniref:SMR family transporter n=1 Tax=Brevibacillus massiliensis TaxID=1118054 RepID=UPI00031D3616|nr:SMR family transporter [Brevibacillus massiliensis]
MTIPLLLVLCSGIMHAAWNFITKKEKHKTVFLWMATFVAFFLLLPFFIAELAHFRIPLHVWFFVALSILYQIGYYLLLDKAYTYSDLSQVYPLIRGTGALLVTVLGVMLFRESLSWIGWVGLDCIVGGLFAISGISPSKITGGNGPGLKGVAAGVGVGLCITGYTVADKVILQHMSPIILIQLTYITYLLIALRTVLRSQAAVGECRKHWHTVLLGALLVPGSTMLFMFAMQLSPLSYVAPIREIGTVIGTVLGILVLKELRGVRRVAMSIVITAGVILIGIGR